MTPCRPTLMSLVLLVLLATGPACGPPEPEGPFLVAPYVQLADAAAPSAGEGLAVLWHAEETDPVPADPAGAWHVEYRQPGGRVADWTPAPPPTSRRVAVPSIDPHRVFRAAMSGLEPGVEVEYRVLKDGEAVFTATARVRRPAGVPQRVVLFGDCGSGSREQGELAAQVHAAQPDYVVIPGDVVYSRGRISEYRRKFFPVYNAEAADPDVGAPMLRAVPFLPAPGNHDLLFRDLDDDPDALAYFLYWDLPRNGPDRRAGDPGTPILRGDPERQAAFLAAAGDAYPRTAHYAFDYGDVHWTVLDTNPYVDLDDPGLRDWIARDLAAARGATWRFVVFHQPGFQSSRTHARDQRTRRLAPLLEAGGADLVFAGHVHNYQRTHPLRFVPQDQPDGKPYGSGGQVAGTWTLDTAFDGRTHTQPDGVIYLVTGAGGARLYDPDQQDDPDSWEPYTAAFASQVHSFTAVDVDGPRLTVRQIAADGSELDRFVVTRPPAAPTP